MNVRRQIESLRDAANQLSLSDADVRHCESGIRGELVVEQPAATASDPSERFGFVRPMMEFPVRGFMRRLLCGGQGVHVVEEPWRTPGFPFAAAEIGHRSPAIGPFKLEGIGHSFIYGDEGAIAKLAQLVAVPAVMYLSKSATGRARCGDSRCDPMAALGEWVCLIYDIGLKTKDASLRRYYRLLLPLGCGDGPDDMITGFEDDASITRASFGHPRLWAVLWSAATRRDLAFGRLGLDLAVASRIALDHLLDMKLRYVPPGRPRGAPRRHDPAKDRKLIEAWVLARGKAGLSRKEFCAEKGITLSQFVQAQDRHRKQMVAAQRAR